MPVQPIALLCLYIAAISFWQLLHGCTEQLFSSVVMPLTGAVGYGAKFCILPL